MMFNQEKQKDIGNEKKPIVVVAAMEVEFDFLLKQLENPVCNLVGKFKYYEGTINGYPVIICHCHVMTINATLATYIAIEKYHPIAIINEGTAGAHGKDIHKNDIVIGTKSVNISSLKTPTKKEGEGSNSLEWSIISFIADDKGDRLEFQPGDKNLIKIAQSIEYSDGNIHTGVIGSGDVWNNEADRILWFNRNLGTICEEMESISVYTVANNFNVPVIAIKVISNNEILNESFDESTAIGAQKFAYDLILKMISEYL
ncbi:hypothetical protein M9Y10_027475 [Tritrichomonas musculus]|uniref:Nucleoside phosphorylase domain-containing protein n=1 Tax=Tritrichomonas musculus TaxID=1915356 RepID=A0ABR2H4W5_9EUKA